MENKDPLTGKIIAACFEVHSGLGPGFKESVYHNALKIALEQKKLEYQTEVEYKVDYDNKKVGTLRIDLIVENKVIVEVKAVTGGMPPVFRYQLLSYLKITQLHVGLLINFGNKSCEIKRLVL